MISLSPLLYRLDLLVKFCYNIYTVEEANEVINTRGSDTVRNKIMRERLGRCGYRVITHEVERPASPVRVGAGVRTRLKATHAATTT